MRSEKAGVWKGQTQTMVGLSFKHPLEYDLIELFFLRYKYLSKRQDAKLSFDTLAKRHTTESKRMTRNLLQELSQQLKYNKREFGSFLMYI